MYDKMMVIKRYARIDVLKKGTALFIQMSIPILILILAIAMLNVAVRFIDDLSLMKVYSVDESLAVAQVSENLKARSLNPSGFFNYGYLYNSTAYYLLRVTELFGASAPSEQTIALYMRIISFLSYIASGIILFMTTILLGVNRSIAAAFTFLFMSFNNYVYWGCHIHPDTLQTLLVLLSFYVLVRVKHYPSSVLA